MDIHGISIQKILTVLGGLFVARWILFTIVIWGLLRVQKLNYTWPGLLLTTALGSVAYFIPLGFVAAAAAFVIVYIGLKIVTQAEHTDLMFSIVISNAIMYVASLWLITAFLPDLKTMREAVNGNEERQLAAIPDYAGMMNKASNTFANAASRGNPDQAPAKTGSKFTPSTIIAKAAGLRLKGITMMRGGGLAMIQSDGRTESIGVKESITVKASSGIVRFTCQSITTNRVTLVLQGSNPPRTVELKLE